MSHCSLTPGTQLFYDCVTTPDIRAHPRFGHSAYTRCTPKQSGKYM